MVPENSRRTVQVRFFGDKDLLHNLMANGTLKAGQSGGKIFFRLTDIKALADRVSELESVLGEIQGRIGEIIGQEE